MYEFDINDIKIVNLLKTAEWSASEMRPRAQGAIFPSVRYAIVLQAHDRRRGDPDQRGGQS